MENKKEKTGYSSTGSHIARLAREMSLFNELLCSEFISLSYRRPCS